MDLLTPLTNSSDFKVRHSLKLSNIRHCDSVLQGFAKVLIYGFTFSPIATTKFSLIRWDLTPQPNAAPNGSES